MSSPTPIIMPFLWMPPLDHDIFTLVMAFFDLRSASSSDHRLRKTTLLSIALTCKLWMGLANHHLYHTIPTNRVPDLPALLKIMKLKGRHIREIWWNCLPDADHDMELVIDDQDTNWQQTHELTALHNPPSNFADALKDLLLLTNKHNISHFFKLDVLSAHVPRLLCILAFVPELGLHANDVAWDLFTPTHFHGNLVHEVLLSGAQYVLDYLPRLQRLSVTRLHQLMSIYLTRIMNLDHLSVLQLQHPSFPSQTDLCAFLGVFKSLSDISLRNVRLESRSGSCVLYHGGPRWKRLEITGESGDIRHCTPCLSKRAGHLEDLKTIHDRFTGNLVPSLIRRSSGTLMGLSLITPSGSFLDLSACGMLSYLDIDLGTNTSSEVITRLKPTLRSITSPRLASLRFDVTRAPPQWTWIILRPTLVMAQFRKLHELLVHVTLDTMESEEEARAAVNVLSNLRGFGCHVARR